MKGFGSDIAEWPEQHVFFYSLSVLFITFSFMHFGRCFSCFSVYAVPGNCTHDPCIASTIALQFEPFACMIWGKVTCFHHGLWRHLLILEFLCTFWKCNSHPIHFYKIKMQVKTWLLRPSLYVKLSIYRAQMQNGLWFCKMVLFHFKSPVCVRWRGINHS